MGTQEQVMGGRNWIQKAGEWIPGFRGYYAREHRRDTDKLLREAVAARLKAAVDRLGEASVAMTKEKRLDEVERLQRLSQRLATLADRTRTAAQGYSGFFDALKIRESELDRLHAHDAAIFQTAEAAKAAATGALETLAAEIESMLDARKEILLDLSK